MECSIDKQRMSCFVLLLFAVALGNDDNESHQSYTLHNGLPIPTDRHVGFYYNDTIYILFGQYYRNLTTQDTALHNDYLTFNPSTQRYVLSKFIQIHTY